MPIDITAPFATPEQMGERTQGQITTATHPSLADELAAATADIRAFCRWHIAPRAQVEYRRIWASPDDVWLPAMEIASIDEVIIDGTAWDAAALAAAEFDPLTGWTNLRGRSVLVTFTAGFEEVPANIVAATLELAANALGTSLGITREQAGSVSVTFGRTGGGIDEESPGGRRLTAYQIGRLP